MSLPNFRFALTRLSILVAFLVVMLLAAPASARAQGAGPDAAPTPGGTFSTRDVGFEPHLDAQAPLELVFRDESGKSVQLGDYVKAGRPVLLSLNDFTCQDLCPLELRSLVDAMNEVPFRLGTEYAALAVSINPANTPQDASDMREAIMHRYGRPDAPDAVDGWHFLTGDQEAITQLAKTVGFRYVYDPLAKDFAHPVGVILLTPGGQIARYLYGMDFPPNDLRLAINEASQGKVSTPIDPVLLLCYHYDVATGRYTNIALGAVRAGGILTLLGLGAFLGVMWRREFKGRHVGARGLSDDPGRRESSIVMRKGPSVWDAEGPEQALGERGLAGPNSATRKRPSVNDAAGLPRGQSGDSGPVEEVE